MNTWIFLSYVLAVWFGIAIGWTVIHIIARKAIKEEFRDRGDKPI